MTPAEHRVAAEKLLADAACSGSDVTRPCMPTGQPIGGRTDLQYSHSQMIARAHVHALLAQEFD